MRGFKIVSICLIILCLPTGVLAQESLHGNKNESFALAEAYMNLSLTEKYFDSLSISRISKIIPYEKGELGALKNKKFIRKNSELYNFSYSLLHFNKAKLLFRNKKEITRDELVEWKKALGLANRYYKRALTKLLFTKPDTSLHDLINFNQDSKESLSLEIEDLRVEFTPYFNNDIYPEYKKIFDDAKHSNNYNFLKLWSLAVNYNLSLEFSILNELGDKLLRFLKPSGDIIFELHPKLDLISRYIQLKYIASDQYKKTLTYDQKVKLYDLYSEFKLDLQTEKDKFIRKELNSEVIQTLYKALLKKYPDQRFTSLPPKKTTTKTIESGGGGDGDSDADKAGNQHFFPNPAPLPSDSLTITNFKPSLTTLGQVDSHLDGILNVAGYRGQLHYYYDLDGFALTTSLEKFNTDGSMVDYDERWVKNMGSDGKFSFYETFKSLFFEMESEFRMFAVITASKNVTINDTPLSAGLAEKLVLNSYSTLPENLKNKTLTNKNLSVLVYYFHQSDIGEVPMLDISGKISAREHLSIAGLDDLIKN